MNRDEKAMANREKHLLASAPHPQQSLRLMYHPDSLWSLLPIHGMVIDNHTPKLPGLLLLNLRSWGMKVEKQEEKRRGREKRSGEKAKRKKKRQK